MFTFRTEEDAFSIVFGCFNSQTHNDRTIAKWVETVIALDWQGDLKVVTYVFVMSLWIPQYFTRDINDDYCSVQKKTKLVYISGLLFLATVNHLSSFIIIIKIFYKNIIYIAKKKRLCHLSLTRLTHYLTKAHAIKNWL